MKKLERRGVVVYTSPQGDSHKRVGIYTEEGMCYFTIFGARSSRGQLTSPLSLFTMGRFHFNIGNKESCKFVDMQIYDTGIMLAHHIDAYYAACMGAEIVKTMIGAEHDKHFKLLVDHTLFLIANPDMWRESAIVFLWRSLVYNGWHPESNALSLHANIEYVEDIFELLARTSVEDAQSHFSSSGFSDMGAFGDERSDTGVSGMTRQGDEAPQKTSRTDFHVDNAQATNTRTSTMTSAQVLDLPVPYSQTKMKKFSEVCAELRTSGQREQQMTINILCNLWHSILGYKLKLSSFIMNSP